MARSSPPPAAPGAIDGETRFAQGDIRGAESRFSPENLPNNVALVDLIKKWALAKNSTPARIALIWLLAQDSFIVPIPGTTQMAHMMENSGADAIEFSGSELSEFNTALAQIEVKGDRLPKFVLDFSDVEAPGKK